MRLIRLEEMTYLSYFCGLHKSVEYGSWLFCGEKS